MVAAIGPLALALLCLQLIAQSSASSLRGVQPELAAFYIPSKEGHFKCRDAAKSIRFNQVNDGYCDCFDGSDEPGTPACPNGHFFCANPGFESRLLNSSFVDDGVCDCCDGSDEPSGRCQNRCRELGLAALQSLASEVADAEAGLHARANYIKAAISSRLAWKARILEIGRVEGSAERKSKVADTARDRLVAQLNKLQAKITRMEKALQPEPAPTADTEKNLEGSESEGVAPGGDAAAAAAVVSEEAEESAEDLAKRTMSQWIPASGQDKENTPDDIAADYVGDAGSDDSADEGEDDAADWDAESADDDIELATQAAESTGEETENSDSLGAGLEIGIIDRFMAWLAGRMAILAGKSPDAAAVDQARAAFNTLQRRVDAARSQATEASSLLDSLQTEKAELERKEGMTFGPEDAYAPLAERCVEALIDKYAYNVCPFSEAEQVENGRSTSLGSWEGFDDALEHMKFRGGEQCWQGPERSMTVRLKCGRTEGLTRVAEPSRCEYTAELTTPAACTEEYVAGLRSKLASKQSLVNAVKDEL